MKTLFYQGIHPSEVFCSKTSLWKSYSVEFLWIAVLWLWILIVVKWSLQQSLFHPWMTFLKHHNFFFQFSPPKLSGCVPVSKRLEKVLVRSSFLNCYGTRACSYSFITKITFFLETFWFQVLSVKVYLY